MIPHAWARSSFNRCEANTACLKRVAWRLKLASASSPEYYCDACARQVAGQLGISQPSGEGYVIFLIESPEQLAWASGQGVILFSASESPWVYPSVDDALRIRALAQACGLKAGVRPHPSRVATLREGQPSGDLTVHASASEGATSPGQNGFDHQMSEAADVTSISGLKTGLPQTGAADMGESINAAAEVKHEQL